MLGTMLTEAEKKLAAVQKKLLASRRERDKLNDKVRVLVKQEKELQREIRHDFPESLWGICKYRTDNPKKLMFIKKILRHVHMTDALFSECSPALKDALLHLNPRESIPFALFNGLDGVDVRTKKECAKLIGQSCCVGQIARTLESLHRIGELHLLNGEFLRVTEDPFFVRAYNLRKNYPELEIPSDNLFPTAHGRSVRSSQKSKGVSSSEYWAFHGCWKNTVPVSR